MTDEPTIRLNLTLAETNLILGALGNLPFVQVNALIGKIHNEGRQQLNGTPAASTGTLSQEAAEIAEAGRAVIAGVE